MNLIVITDPGEVEDEALKVYRLFEEGLEILHYRKPDWSLEKYEDFLKQIPSRFYKNMVIHSHYKLIEKYNLRGIHLTGKYLAEVDEVSVKEVFKAISKRRLTISTSMHSIQEIQEDKRKYNYIFLSPLFDSISKKTYSSKMKSEEVKVFLKEYKNPEKVVALGGIHKANIKKVIELGFTSAAMLGALWSLDDPAKEFRKIKISIHES